MEAVLVAKGTFLGESMLKITRGSCQLFHELEELEFPEPPDFKLQRRMGPAVAN